MDGTAGAKKKLNLLFRERINQNAWTITMAADKCGVPDPSLRSWLLRNCFPHEAAEKLAMLLGMSAAEVKRLDQTYEVKWTRPSKASRPAGDDLYSGFVSLDRKMARLRVPMEKFSRQIGIMFRRLKQDELYICATATVTPLELELDSKDRQSWFADLAEGVANGGLILYVRPAHDIYTLYYDTYNIKEIPSVDDMTREFNQLREELTKYLQTQKKLPPAKASALVRSHLHQMLVGKDEHFPFFMPGFVISMFHTKDPDYNPKRRMVVRQPGNRCGPIYMEEYTVFDKRFGDAVLKLVNNRLKAGKEPDEATKVLVNVKRILEAMPGIW